jgi:hypothetical protein
MKGNEKVRKIQETISFCESPPSVFEIQKYISIYLRFSRLFLRHPSIVRWIIIT